MSDSANTEPTEPNAFEKIAVLDYQPIVTEFELPGDEEWSEVATPHLIVARLGLSMCKKTKSELIDSVGKANDISEFSLLMKRLQESKDFFQEITDILKQAEMRCMVAAAAKLREGSGE